MPVKVSLSAQIKDGIAAVTLHASGFAPPARPGARPAAGPRSIDTATVTLNGQSVASIYLGTTLADPTEVGFSVAGVKPGDVIAVTGRDDLGGELSAETKVAG